MRNRILTMVFFIATLLPQFPVIGQLPNVTGKWSLRTDEANSVRFPPHLDAKRVAGFSGKIVSGVYWREKEEMTVFLAECETREQAFGLFAVATTERRHGIVGDAFSIERSAEHIHYGPFYLYISAAGRRDARPAQDLIAALKRALFNRADCFASDIPLKTDDRILGSEMYFPPDRRAWADAEFPGLEPIRDIIIERGAWFARYTIHGVETQRLLLALPVRQIQALKILEAGIVERYVKAGQQIPHCKLATYKWKSYVIHILPGNGRLLIVVADASDAGSCTWALTIDEE